MSQSIFSLLFFIFNNYFVSPLNFLFINLYFSPNFLSGKFVQNFHTAFGNFEDNSCSSKDSMVDMDCKGNHKEFGSNPLK